MRIVNVFRSNYCKVVFATSLLLTWFLVPKKIFYGYYTILGIMFILSTSLVMTCIVRSIKDRAMIAKSSGAALATIIGFGAMQSCMIGAPVCGATVTTGILALIFPNFALGALQQYAQIALVLSLALQLIALYYMNCFRR